VFSLGECNDIWRETGHFGVTEWSSLALKMQVKSSKSHGRMSVNTVCRESTEYSDWEPDGYGINLQPPKRRSQRQIKRRRWSSLEASESSDADADDKGKVKVKVDSDDGETGRKSSRRGIMTRSRKKLTMGKQKKRVSVLCFMVLSLVYLIALILCYAFVVN